MQTGPNETPITYYKLIAFKNSSEKDFIKALGLYIDSIEAPSLTDPNQITYCVDHYHEHYQNSRFIVAGLYQNKQLIGYCQFIFISEEKIVFIDYVVIDPQFRGLNIFYTFLEKIREFIHLQGFDYKYLLCELNIQNNTENVIPKKTQMLVKLLKSNNFGKVKTDYYQPMLGSQNLESELKSILMLYPANHYGSIKRETFIHIIETIYFKHYERWYKLFMTETELIAYNIHLNKLYKKLVDNVVNVPLIDLEKEDDIMGELNLRKSKKSKTKKTALFILGFIGLLAIMLIGSFLVRRHFNFSPKDQLYLMIAVGLIYVAILALFNEKAAKLLNKLIEKFVENNT